MPEAKVSSSEETSVVGLTFDSFDSFGAFVANSASWLSKKQVFISTENSLPIGTAVSVEISIKLGPPLIRGLGRVSWIRKQAMRADQPPGLGIGILYLDPASAALIDAVERCRPASGFGAILPASAAAGSSDRQTGEATVGTAMRDVAQDQTIVEKPATDGETRASVSAASKTSKASLTEARSFRKDHTPSGTIVSLDSALDALGGVSFSDVEAAVSREIDAVVLHAKIQKERQRAVAEAASSLLGIDSSADIPTSETHGVQALQATDPDAAATFAELDDAVLVGTLELALAEIPSDAGLGLGGESPIGTSQPGAKTPDPDTVAVAFGTEAPGANAAEKEASATELAAGNRELASEPSTAFKLEDLTQEAETREAWETERRTRVEAPRSIVVSLSDLELEAWDGATCQVRLFQSYRTKSRNLGTWKRFAMIWRGRGWRVASESLVR